MRVGLMAVTSLFLALAQVPILLSIAQASPNQIKTGNSELLDLFPTDLDCVCINTKKQTRALISKEEKVGQDIFQVFRRRSDNVELFRVNIGQIVAGNRVAWWNYGIAVERDLNRDGMLDYSWYGGDDTSDDLLVFLSQPNGKYSGLDVYKTLQAVWERRYPDKQLIDLGMSSGASATKVNLFRQGTDVILRMVVQTSLFSPEEYAVKIGSSEFIWK